MKIGILKDRNQFGHKGGTDNYIHLLVENIDDVGVYYNILNDRNAKENTDLYLGFKSQSYRKYISDYAIHESNSKAETIVLLHKLNNKETNTSLLEFCQMSDDIVLQKCLSFTKYVNNGKIIRVNNVGGYCFIDDTEDYDEVFEPTVEQIESFIRKGDLDKPTINLTKEVLVVENSNYLHNTFTDVLRSYGINYYDTIFNLKETFRFLSDSEIVELFVNAVNKNLKTICFETTGQDLHQIRKMEILLSKVKQITNKDISLLIKTHSKKVLEIFNNFTLIK